MINLIPYPYGNDAKDALDGSLKELECFFSRGQNLFYKRREMVSRGQDSSGVLYVKVGFIRVYRLSEQGEELTLIILKPRDLFPVTWGLEANIGDYYLEAITAVEISRLPKEKLWAFLKTHPRIYHELTNSILARFGGLLARMEFMVFGNAYTKVASTLLVCARRFGERQGNDILVKLPLTHKDIATLVGVTRETTCLEMKKMEKKGLISYRGRLLLVKDLKKLEKDSLFHNETGIPLNNSL